MEFIVDKTEYNWAQSNFHSKAYPVDKRYLNFEMYISDDSAPLIYEDYSLKKQVNKYVINRFNNDKYYYEIHTGFNSTNGNISDRNIKEWGPFTISLYIVEDSTLINETFKKMDKLILELKNEGFNSFHLNLLVVKKPYSLKKLENEIFQEIDAITRLETNNKIFLDCQYDDGVSKPPFSSTCKNK